MISGYWGWIFCLVCDSTSRLQRRHCRQWHCTSPNPDRRRRKLRIEIFESLRIGVRRNQKWSKDQPPQQRSRQKCSKKQEKFEFEVFFGVSSRAGWSFAWIRRSSLHDCRLGKRKEFARLRNRSSTRSRGNLNSILIYFKCKHLK